MSEERKLRKKSKSGRVLLHTVVSLITILFFIPLYFFFNNAFKGKDFISTQPMFLTPESATFDNIKMAWKLLKYPEAFLNSLLILVIAAFVMILFGSMTAYVIAIIGGKLLNKVYFGIIALMTIPVYVAMIPLAKELAVLRLINTHVGTALVYVAFALPFVVFLYVGNMKSLPKELYEAATIDGCSIYKTYFFIYMPLLKTVTGTVLILRGMYMWNDILIPLLTVRSAAMQTLPQRLVALAATNMTRWDAMFGAAFLISAPVIILFLLLQKTFIQGIVDGSVKG